MPQLIVTVQGVEVKHIFLHKDRTLLGRRPDNDIVLDTLVVSGQHCAFDLVGVADVFVEDLGSTNGTYINDHMLKRRSLLQDGDVIAIGPFRLKYLQASEASSKFGETMAMVVDPQRSVQGHASFRVLTGTSAGLEVPVVKAVTTFGKPGVCVVSVSHRRTGYFVGLLSGVSAPRLNGRTLDEEPVPLADADVLDLDGTQMVFQLRE